MSTCASRIGGVKCQRPGRYFLAPVAGRERTHVLACGHHLKRLVDAQLKVWGGVIVGHSSPGKS